MKIFYLIFALDKIDIFSKKFAKNLLTEKDFVEIEIVYNNSSLSFFTVLTKMVHYTVVNGHGAFAV